MRQRLHTDHYEQDRPARGYLSAGHLLKSTSGLSSQSF